MQKNIIVKKIKYNLPKRDILEDVTFRINTNERLALFGENGAGKSTLLKILCGEIQEYEGEVVKEGHVRFFYVKQEFPKEYFEKSILDFIIEQATIKNLKKVFDHSRDLGYDLESNQDKLCGELSGGQQKILHLSVALSTSPDYLLLDEPENHIDIVSHRNLIDKLQNFRGGIIFVSHDRFLIDSVCTKVGELYEGILYVSDGGYDAYLENKEARIAGREREWKEDEKRIKQLHKTYNMLKRSAVQGLNLGLYRRVQEELAELKEKHADFIVDERESKIKIKLSEEGLHSGKLLVRFENAEFSYKDDDKKILKNIFKKTNIELRSGKKVVLLGRNGVGKTSFLRCLMGEEKLDNGKLTVGENIKVSYFDQHANFPVGENALKIIGEKLNMVDDVAKRFLGQYRFDLERMLTKVENLSGGERMRLRFALTFGQRPDLLILDEPTNHIDEVTWDVLLNAVKDFKGTILLVTHDYEFISEFEPDYFWMFHKFQVVERHKFLEDLLEEMKN